MQRFESVLADPGLPERIVQRVAGGETLPEIARSMGLPRTRFLCWVAANGELSDACRRVRELAGIELRFEGLEIVDGASEETVGVAKLQSDYREKLSRDLHKPLFGKFTQHQHTVTLDLGERLRRARERVVEAVPVVLSDPDEGLI